MTEPVTLRAAAGDADAEWCARLMSTSEPWITLGRDHERSLAVVRDPTREVHVAWAGGERVGFVILCLVGPFTGYLQTLCLAPAWRGRGVGSRLLAWAEEHIFARSPNVFLCVSSFNRDARRLYERSGYVYVGELADHLVRGHSELLFRKSRGPWSEFGR